MVDRLRAERWLSLPPERDFGFGLEAEYFLADAASLRPLWYQDMAFSTLNKALESIPIHDFPSLDGLECNPPHRKIMPFVVEGYHVAGAAESSIDILPKGVEIRTPKCKSIDECLGVLRILHHRMQEALKDIGLVAVALSHHPLADSFEGPQEGRSREFWAWAKQAMVTYGPDINVSLPEGLRKRLDLAELDAKVNYYSPALTALSLASPFYKGKLWEPPSRKEIGRSARTFKRSVVAPAIEIHPEQAWRLEYKTFEMACGVADYRCFFLLWLQVLLDESLLGRASHHTRIYDLGAISQSGLHEPFIRDRAYVLLEHAFRELPRWGFDPAPLEKMVTRLDHRRTPADEMIETFRFHPSLAAILANRTQLVPERAEERWHPVPDAREHAARPYEM